MAAVLRRLFYSKSEVRIFPKNKRVSLGCLRCESTEDSKDSAKQDEFRVLRLYPPRTSAKTTRTVRVKKLPPPRTTLMTPDQDWTNIWPGPKTFNPNVVPLPIRQGRNKYGPAPDKFANTELMKIPNFLHLTPPAIEKHCKAIKKFCTEWPENLKTDEDIEKHFPVEIINSDYCHSSPSIRDPKSRIISLKIKLKNLELDKHSKDKFLRLVGPRYDPETDYVTLTTDCCPLKKQNYDYVYYLLTALYFESWKYEDWEKEKSGDDMETYIFSQRKSFDYVKATFDYNNRQLPDLEDYGKAVEDWVNNGDEPSSIENFKKAAIKLLSLPSLEPSS